MSAKRLFQISSLIIIITGIKVEARSVYTGGVAEEWVARYSDGNDERADAIALDSSGNIYVTGYSNHNSTTIKYIPNGNQIWVTNYVWSWGGCSSTLSYAPAAIAVDSNVYITGGGYSCGEASYTTVTFDKNNGNKIWEATPDWGPPVAGGRAIALDNSGIVYVTGGGWTEIGELSEWSMRTCKYESNGNLIWTSHYADPLEPPEFQHCYKRSGGRAIAIDKSDNVYVTGSHFGCFKGPSGLVCNSGDDYFTIKYDVNGNQLWAIPYDDSNHDDFATAIALDNSNNVYVTGVSSNGTNNDYATIKYDTNGNLLQVARYHGPGAGNDGASAIAVDSSGNVYVTGTSTDSNGASSYATIKYDTNLNQQWVARYSGSASAIALDSSGNVYVTGTSDGGCTGNDYATIKYDTNGNQLWVGRYNGLGNGDDEATAIAIDNSGKVYITGYSMDINGTYDYATIKYSSGNPSTVTDMAIFDDVHNGDCRKPGDEITYTIDYNCPAEQTNVNNVNILDYLPNDVEFISADSNGTYDSPSNTVTWNIGTLLLGHGGSVSLTVRVKCSQPGSTITNHCEMNGTCIDPIYVDENTPVCCCPTLTKVDNTTGCVGPGKDVNYTICYAAGGYGDTNVMITDYLPNEVNYISSVPAGTHNSDNNTVTWGINFSAGASGCIELAVQVKHNVIRGGTITNYCQLIGNCVDINTHDTISVCSTGYPIYVDISATGGNNGYSWEDAFTNLQDALKAAKDFNCNEIRVAQGIYRPDINSAHPNRAATFQLLNGVALYGGFPMGGGTWEDRKPSVYETILSGDLLGNDRQVAEPCDLLTDPCWADNSYHVVTGSGTNATAILDGFTITGGDANSDYPYSYGGGMYNDDGNPTVKICKFKWNAAQSGGGMYTTTDWDVNATITNCTFIENYGDSGGGISIGARGVAYITNCTFVANGADPGYGSAIYGIPSGQYPDVVIVTNCILWGNENGQISGDIDANVTYSDIDGGWAGVGNIYEYPIFEADGYHLKMCSPCIDAGTNMPAGGLPATDIDGQTRIMSGQCAGAAVVDMGADEYLPDCDALLYAHCLKPACNAIAALYLGVPNINLTWCPGRLAASHDVYFGTDYSDVDNATISTPIIYKGRRSDPNYLATGLKAGNTYFWRIDEVNGANIWRGPVYSFRTGLFIDDFERYNSFADLNANWPNGYQLTHAGGPGNCTNPLAKGYSGRALIEDATGKHLQYTYNNDNTHSEWNGMNFSETKISYSGSGVSFTGGGAISPEPNTLRIDYKGRATNAANVISPAGCPLPDGNGDLDRMYVAIEDTAGNVAIYLNPDPNAQLVTNWTPWPIPLKDINDINHGIGPDGNPHTVNLNAITGFAIGFGIRGDTVTGDQDGVDANSIVMFDNIQLEPPFIPQQCGQLPADFTCDCIVNFADFAIMGEEWRTSGIKADIYKDGNNRVDLMDLAVLADEWLK